MPAAHPARRAFVAVAWVAVVVALLKGFRMPGLWAVTHLCLNYSYGFIRRGLVGQLIRMVGSPWIYRYGIMAAVSVLMMVGVGTTLALVTRRALRTDRGDVGLWGAVLAFVSAPGLVFFIHLIGYLDYFGLLLLLLFILLALRTRRRWMMFAAAVGVGVLLALIHEVLVVMFAPPVLFAMLCRLAGDHVAHGAAAPAGAARSRRLLWPMAVAGAMTALMLAAAVGVSMIGSPKDGAAIWELQKSLIARAHFPLRGDVFGALYRPSSDNIRTLMPQFWRAAANREYLVVGWVTTLPAVGFLSYYGVRLIRRLRVDGVPTWTQWILIAVLIGGTLAPLSLNLIGWDSARWNSICLMTAFSGVLCLRLFLPTAAGHRIGDPLTLALAGGAVVLGLASTDYRGFLFDGYKVHWFPFIEQLNSVLEVVHGQYRFTPPM